MNRGWIVELEPGVYKADCSGRTLVIDNARRYKTISAATHGLAMMRYFSRFLNAKIYHDDHIEAEPAQEEGKPEVGDVVAWDALKKLAEEQFEVRAKHAREGKQAGIEAGDTSEVQCFACELQILHRGYDSWLMAYHLMRAAEVKRRVELSGSM